MKNTEKINIQVIIYRKLFQQASVRNIGFVIISALLRIMDLVADMLRTREAAFLKVNGTTMFASALTSLLLIAQLSRQVSNSTRSPIGSMDMSALANSIETKLDGIKYRAANVSVSIDEVTRSLEADVSYKIKENENRKRLIGNLTSYAELLQNETEPIAAKLPNLLKLYEQAKQTAASSACYCSNVAFCGLFWYSYYRNCHRRHYENWKLEKKALLAVKDHYSNHVELLLKFKMTAEKLNELRADYFMVKNASYVSTVKLQISRSLRKYIGNIKIYLTSLTNNLRMLVALSKQINSVRFSRDPNANRIQKPLMAIAETLTDPKFETARNALDTTGRSALVADCLLQTSNNTNCTN